MKMSDRNTALHLLTDNDHICYTVKNAEAEVKEARNFFNGDFLGMRQIFTRKVQYISKPFFEAFVKAHEKTAFRFCKEPVEQSGTFIVPSRPTGQMTIFYRIAAKRDGEDEWLMECTIVVFYNSKDHVRPLLLAVIRRAETIHTTYIDDDYKLDCTTPEELMSLVLCLNIFMKYCEVETKTVPPGKKAFKANQKYVNDTKSPIEVLDATWFTTFIRSEEFTVGAATGGFFRLQPCGKDNKDRKLIWISPFKKHGYTLKAKVLSDPQR
jgi:hypothetical protein